MKGKRKGIVVITAVLAVVAIILGVFAYNEYQYWKDQEKIWMNMTHTYRGKIVHVAEMREGGILLYVDVPGLNISGELQEFWITEESFVGEELMKELKARIPGASVKISCYSTPREGLVHGHSVRPVIDINYYEE